jgi:hypothetical protein
MPRKSAAELSIVTGIGSRANRLRPPPTLSEAERTAFVEIVNSCDPKHFVRSDLPLLCRYAEASVLAERAAHELRQGAVIGGRPSPWIAVQEKSVRAMVRTAWTCTGSHLSASHSKTYRRPRDRPR